MKKITLATSLFLAPVLASAQSGVQAQSQAKVDASVSASGTTGTRPAQADAAMATSASTAARAEQRLSADAQAKVEANVRAARERRLPEQPIRQRVAEGEAKGASDAQIVAASSRSLVDMQASFDAMVRGGHSKPSDAEISHGTQLMARGYTSAQLEGIARKAPVDRSLVVAFETAASLQASGATTASAVAQLESQLAAHASDAQLSSLAVNANGAVGLDGVLNVGRGAGNAAAGSAASAGMTAAGAGSVTGTGAAVTGGVAGTLRGALGKP